MRYYFAVYKNDVVGRGHTKRQAREDAKHYLFSEEEQSKVMVHQTDTLSWDMHYCGYSGWLFFNINRDRILFRPNDSVTIINEKTKFFIQQDLDGQYYQHKIKII